MADRQPDHPVDPLFLAALVAAGVRRVGDAGGGPADDVRGGALGAVGVQLAALALPLRAARRRGLGAVPRAADPVEPELGAQRLGPGLHPLRQPALHRQGGRAGDLAHPQLRRRRRLGLLRAAGVADGLSGARHVGRGFRAGAGGAGRARALPDRGGGGGRPDRRSGDPAGEAAGAGVAERAQAGGGVRLPRAAIPRPDAAGRLVRAAASGEHSARGAHDGGRGGSEGGRRGGSSPCRRGPSRSGSPPTRPR